uniref:Polycystin family receptor for egg jelly n=1 Tax=Latimeria chalumnae TaxID=7897 RepID=H3AQZ1_LATCH
MFDSGLAKTGVPVHIVWFIPLQDSVFQCKWIFTLQVLDAGTVVHFTYTYSDRDAKAAAFIPDANLVFNPDDYAGFVASVTFQTSGVKQILLKPKFNMYAFRVLQSVIFCLTNPCNIPKATIIKPEFSIPIIQTEPGSQLTVYATVGFNCRNAQKITLSWKVYKVPNATTEPNWKNPLNLPRLTVNQSSLEIPKFILSYGLYLLNFTVTVITSDLAVPVMYHSDRVLVESKKSELLAIIAGGTYRTVGFKGNWTLDGSLSADPDSPNPLDGVEFIWYCTINASDYTAMKLSSNKICHPDQTNFRWLTSSVVEFSAEKLAGNIVYYFRLVIQKDSRKSYSDQTVAVLPGTPPEVMLSCTENCKKYLIPTQRFRLSAKCLNCNKASSPTYEWSLFSADTSSEVYLDWDSETSTGRFLPYLIVNAFSFVSVASKSYFLQIKVTTRSGLPAISQYLFHVLSQPSTGICSISPTSGFTLETKFTIACDGFFNIYAPLTYKMIAATDSSEQSRISSLQDHVLGTVLYLGYNSTVSGIFLPSGLPSNNHGLLICVYVFDVHQASTQVTVKVTVKDRTRKGSNVPESLLALTTKQDSLLSLYITGGDFLEAGNLVYMAASVLNDYVVDVNKPEPTNTDRIVFREHLINASTNLPIHTSLDVSQAASSISAITQQKDELSQYTQHTAVKMISAMSSAIRKFTEDNIGSENTENLCASILTAASNIMSASLLKLDQVITGVLSVVGNLRKAIFYGKVPGEDATKLQSKDWNATLRKNEKLDVSDSFAASKDCVNCFYPQLSNSSTLSPDAEVLSTVYEFKQNPFPWLNNGENLSTSVLGFEMNAIGTDGTRKEIIPEVMEGVMLMTNDMFTHMAAVGPDHAGNIGAEISFELMLEKDSEAFLEFVSELNEAFKVQVFNGPSSSSLIITYQIPYRKRQLAKSRNIGSSEVYIGIPMKDPSVVHLPLKALSETSNKETTYWNITVLIQFQNKVRYTEKTKMNISIFTATCLNFDGLSGKWNIGFCTLGPLTSKHKVHCICNNTKKTAFTSKIASEYHIPVSLPKLLCSKVFVVPNIVDIRKTRLILRRINGNLVTLLTVVVIFITYIIAAVWTIRKDKADRNSRGHVIILPDNDPYDKICYLVTVYTGSKFGAETTADVFLTLIGTAGQSDVHLLKHPHHPALQRGGIDNFLLTAKDSLGDILHIRIWHNNRGHSPDWFLSRLKVENMYTKQVWHFMCRKWFTSEQGDCQIDRTFAVKDLNEPIKKMDYFHINMANSLEINHIWISVFTPTATDSFNRIQKLSCGLAMLMTGLLTSIMLFHTEVSEDQIMFIRPVVIGFESALVTVPVGMIISALFRYAQREQEDSVHSPYQATKKHHPDEESRDWKERLEKWYLVEAAPETAEENPQENDKQKAASQSLYSTGNVKSKPRSLKMGCCKINCVVPESNTDVIETEEYRETSSTTKDSATKPKRFQNMSKMVISTKYTIVFSWWCVYVAWFAVLFISGVSGFFIILYGLSYGKETSVEWLYATVLSLFQSICIIQPFKIALVSGLFSVHQRKCRDIPWTDEYKLLEIDLDEFPKNTDELREQHFELIKMRKSKKYRPLEEDEIIIMKKRHAIRTKASVFLKGIVSHFIFLILVLYIAYSQDYSNAFYYNQVIKRQFSLGLSDIDRIEGFYSWINKTFLFLIHNDINPTFLTGSSSKILGLPRLRQLRSKPGKIHCYKNKSFDYSVLMEKISCHHEFSSRRKDKVNYKKSWNIIDSTLIDHNISKYMYTGFTYEQNILPWAYYSYGSLNIYPPGGYTVYFFPAEKFKNSTKRLIDLKKGNWYDENTWAVILEMTTFNPDVNLLCTVLIIFETLPLGIVKGDLSVKSFSLPDFEHQDETDIAINIIFVIFLIIYTIDEVITVVHERTVYLKKFSNIINFGLKFMLFLVVTLTIAKLVLATDLLDYYLLHQLEFIPFHTVSALDETLRITGGFLVFFTVLKTLRFARFVYDVRLAERSMLAALPGIISMALVVAIYLFTYMAFGYLVFGQHEWNYNSVLHATQTILAYCGSAFSDVKFSSNRFLGGLYLSSFLLVMICVLINLFQSVIILAYEDMRQPVYEEPSDEAEVVLFLVQKCRHIWYSIRGKYEDLKREPKILNTVIYGQPESKCGRTLGLKTKEVSGRRLTYLHI